MVYRLKFVIKNILPKLTLIKRTNWELKNYTTLHDLCTFSFINLLNYFVQGSKEGDYDNIQVVHVIISSRIGYILTDIYNSSVHFYSNGNISTDI